MSGEAEALTPGVVTVSGKRGLLPDGLDDLDTKSYRNAKLNAIHKASRFVRSLICEGAKAALRKLEQSPESFEYPPLSPPFTRTIRFRKNGSIPPYETADEHPDSIIAFLNFPIAEG